MQDIHIQAVPRHMHLGTLIPQICRKLIFAARSFSRHENLFINLLNVTAIFYVISSRVFLLGPSHHYYTSKCALSTASVYSTPIGDLPIDVEGIQISPNSYENNK